MRNGALRVTWSCRPRYATGAWPVWQDGHVRFTILAFHAHPDDEALLTAGTLARAAAEGHRTVLVVATLGEAGLTRPGVPADVLRETRRAELAASAAALGVARVEVLGYPDSGMHGEAGGPAAFCRAD